MDYFAFMNECLCVREGYSTTWDYFDNCVRYKELELPKLDDINQDINYLNAFQRHLQNMLVRFDTIFKEVDNHIHVVNLRTSSCEERILNKVSMRFSTTVTQQMEKISGYAVSAMNTFKSQIQEVLDTHLLIQSESIASM